MQSMLCVFESAGYPCSKRHALYLCRQNLHKKWEAHANCDFASMWSRAIGGYVGFAQYFVGIYYSYKLKK